MILLLLFFVTVALPFISLAQATCPDLAGKFVCPAGEAEYPLMLEVSQSLPATHAILATQPNMPLNIELKGNFISDGQESVYPEKNGFSLSECNTPSSGILVGVKNLNVLINYPYEKNGQELLAVKKILVLAP